MVHLTNVLGPSAAAELMSMIYVAWTVELYVLRMYWYQSTIYHVVYNHTQYTLAWYVPNCSQKAPTCTPLQKASTVRRGTISTSRHAGKTRPAVRIKLFLK